MGEKLGSVRMKERSGVRVLIWGKEKEAKKKGQNSVVSLSHVPEPQPAASNRTRAVPIFFLRKKKEYVLRHTQSVPIP